MEQNKNIKLKKLPPKVKKSWIFMGVLGAIFVVSVVNSVIVNITDPEVKIPDVIGLTKKEACSKIEETGMLCKTGSNYDSSLDSQKVKDIYVYNKDGNSNFNATNTMRARKSSTISLNFEETEKQKTERETKEAKYKAEQEAEEAKKKAKESETKAETTPSQSSSPAQNVASGYEYDKISNGMSESDVDKALSGYKKTITSETEVLGSKYKYVGYSKGDILKGEKIKSISVTFENGAVESKTFSEL